MKSNTCIPNVYSSMLELNNHHSFFNLAGFTSNCDVVLKLEGLNPAGSIKIKPALKMIEDLEKKAQ